VIRFRDAELLTAVKRLEIPSLCSPYAAAIQLTPMIWAPP